MILTDEILEKAARAIFEEKQGLLTWDTCISKENFRRYARACITAILPDIVEECAKVCDNAAVVMGRSAEGASSIESNLLATGAKAVSEDLAASIRQLSTNTKG